MLEGLFGVLAFFATLLVFGVGGASILLALLRRQPRRAWTVARLCLGWLAGYLALLLLVSFTSRPVVIPLGEERCQKPPPCRLFLDADQRTRQGTEPHQGGVHSGWRLERAFAFSRVAAVLVLVLLEAAAPYLGIHLGPRHTAPLAHGPTDELCLEIHAPNGPRKHSCRRGMALHASRCRSLVGLRDDRDPSVPRAGRAPRRAAATGQADLSLCRLRLFFGRASVSASPN